MPDLAVIVISTNEARWLRACLTTVFEHAGGASLDVVVADNMSTDGTADLVGSEFPQARIVASENRGFGHANNRGLETTSAEFVLFLNPDTEVVEGSFADLVEVMRRRREIGVIGVRQVGSDGELQPSIRRFPTVLRSLCQALGSERWPFRASWTGERVLDPAAYERETQCDWVSGSFMLVRREALDRVSPFDERFFIYCEETDLCLRIKEAGWSIVHLPVMTIVHHGGNESASTRMAAQHGFSQRLYLHKHFPWPRRIAATAAVALGYVLRIRRETARASLSTLLGLRSSPFSTGGRALSGPRVE